MLKDVGKRPFITVGFLGFLLLVPLAITSTAGMIRRLGGRRWRILHRLIYVTAILGVIHYYWLVKSDVRKPLGVRRDGGGALAVARGRVDCGSAQGKSFEKRAGRGTSYRGNRLNVA